MAAKFPKVVAVCALLLMPAGVRLQAQSSTTTSDNYDQLFKRYLEEARQASAARPADGWAWMDGLSLDRRARALNDLITIRVIESIAGAGTADSALSKDSSASLGVAALFGLEKKLPGSMDPAALVAARSNTDFQGSGTTTRASELTALITARVSDVLPSGDLVVEGVREIEINGDRQVVVLSGVVRPSDISPNNVILSTAIGQLRIRYFGRGLMKDNLQPGWLIRILNKVF
jgi:flagellar L-ring protein precursor FlgH